MENYDNSESPKKWYDNKVVVGILIFFFFPVGLYALWKSNNITKGWKVGWTLIIGLICIAALGKNNDDLSVETYKASLTSLDTTSVNRFVNKNYKVVRSFEEKVEKENQLFNRYTIVGDDWTLIFTRTKQGEFSKIECSGNNWNPKMMEVCNQVFDVIDKKIMEFADSKTTHNKKIGNHLVQTVILGNYTTIIVKF